MPDTNPKTDQNKLLASLIIPSTVPSVEEIISKYPPRNLPPEAKVVRVAPSPTGFAHFGLIFTSIVNEHVAKQSNGIFFLRIEDTDKKREVENGTQLIVEALNNFDIKYTEGPISESEETGKYGPYTQSLRQDTYLSVARELLETGNAYPCFCTEEELSTTRSHQEATSIKTGYYGEFAKCRNLNLDQIKDNLQANKPFVIRFKSPTNSQPFTYKDAIKNSITVPANDIDYVLIKSTEQGLGLPVYHLAAMVDDHFQGVNLVIRGDEWLSSLPLHLQIIDSLGWTRPNFGHLSPIMKMDGETTKRKLSKRKDPEAAATFYLEKGIPPQAVRAYVLNIADSRFEDWRKNNPKTDLIKYPFSLSHMGSSGALFDMTKFLDICKQEISYMTAEQVYSQAEKWTKEFNPQFHKVLSSNQEYSTKVFNIERSGDKTRKDLTQWSEVLELFGYFFDEIYQGTPVDLKSENIKDNSQASEIINKFLETYSETDTKEVWLEKIREVCNVLGYASNMKDYKTEPEKYKGSMGDVAMVLRVALSGRKMTPDLYEMMQAMGKSRIISRLKAQIDP